MFDVRQVMEAIVSRLDQCDVNKENNYGMTPLHIAASCGHENLVRILLNNGAKVFSHCDGCLLVFNRLLFGHLYQ